MAKRKLDGEGYNFVLDELAIGTPFVMIHEELVELGYQDFSYDGVRSISRRADPEDLRARRKALQDRIPIADKQARLKRLQRAANRIESKLRGFRTYIEGYEKLEDRLLKVLRQAAEETGDIATGSRVHVTQSQNVQEKSADDWFKEIAKDRRKAVTGD